MANNIAKLNVELTAGISGFSSGLTKAGKELASFGSSVTSIGSTVVGFGTALTALAAGGSLVVLTKNSMEAIDANAKLADRLGLSTEALTGLQYAGNLAGVSSEELTGGLEKMLKALGGAADDGELASNAFTKLGLNAAQLANLPAGEAFATIAQKISEIQNPAERATAAMQIFGRAGQSLLPLMMSGADGIKAAQEEAAKLGLTYSRVDAAKVEQANDAMTRMSSVFTGIINQLAIGLAPYIEAAANKFTDLATSGGGIGPIIGSALEWVAKALATTADYTELLPAAFHGFRAGALEAIAGVLGSIDTLGGGLVKLINILPGVNVSWTDTFGTLQQGMEQVASEEAGKMNDAMAAFHRGDATAAVGKVFDDIRAKSEAAAKATADNAGRMGGAFRNLEDDSKSLQKVADTLASLQKDVSQFGLNDAQKKLADMQAGGASADQIAQAKGLLAVKEQLEAVGKIDTGDPMTTYAAKLEQMQKLYAAGKVTADQFAAMRDTAKTGLDKTLGDQAKQITEDVKTPLEKYQEQVEKLQTLLDRGLISQDTFDKATAKAGQTFDANAGKATTEAPDLFKAGSAEAARLTYDISRGSQKLNDRDYGKQQLAEAQNAGKLLDRIERNTRTTTDADTTVVDV